MVWIQIINVYYDSITNLEIQMIQNKIMDDFILRDPRSSRCY